MSDDLVKRLRKTTQCKRPRHVSKTDRLAAADRIEELEAKLEKAVEAIELARNGLNGLVDSNDAFDALNATLEELKGETDER